MNKTLIKKSLYISSAVIIATGFMLNFISILCGYKNGVTAGGFALSFGIAMLAVIAITAY
ncbi:MAG: hypothetical protein Q4A74_09510 [Cardiobacteriaceae bacterium]|nr:hypothetical protein [Cardiobacteriaceae bacterium]